MHCSLLSPPLLQSSQTLTGDSQRWAHAFQLVMLSVVVGLGAWRRCDADVPYRRSCEASTAAL